MDALRSKSFGRTLRAFGPYLLIELLLPGGTVIALALWLVRRSCGKPAQAPDEVVVVENSVAPAV